MASQSDPEILESEIRKRAYLIWETEGRPDGRRVEHWLRAEAQLRREAQRAHAPTEPTKPKPIPSSSMTRKRNEPKSPSGH